MALTKIITDTIDLSSDETALKMPKGTTAQRPGNLDTQYLVVAGGGGGGFNAGGGGGGGGYLTNYGGTSLSLSSNTAYTVIVGGGGTGATTSAAMGGDGDDSKFGIVGSEITTAGGGGGGTRAVGLRDGANGGSGGGSVGDGLGASGGTATPAGQGNDGGTSSYANAGASGGGGAGAAGDGNVNPGYKGGDGGDGLQNNIDGLNNYYAGGGGGGSQASYGQSSGGQGGGGTGGEGPDTGGSNGTDNTGGGGGGDGNGDDFGGDGGSGVVIIRVPGNYTATFTSGVTANGVSGGGTISPNTSTGDNVWTVTATTDALQTVTFSGTPPTIGETRENTTTGKMEIYTGVTGWRALQQTDQVAAGIVPSNNFKTVLYTGNSTIPYPLTGPVQNIDVGFTPNLTWVKALGTGTAGNSSVVVYDVIRGNYNYMNTSSQYPTSTSGLATDAGIGAITNGFSVLDCGPSATAPYLGGAYGVNASPGSAYGNGQYVSWNWKAGGEPIASNSNTAGSMLADSVSIDGVLQSAYTPSGSPGVYPLRMSINTEAGFNIVEWENPGSPYTQSIPHGLSGAPDLMIVKLYQFANPPSATGNWFVYTKTTGEDKYLKLNSTDAVANGSGFEFINVGADTFQFSYSSSAKTVGYFFKSTPGFSLIGSYMGTGSSTNNPIIYTGFEPAWIMVKCVDSARAWNITDNKRNTTNPRDSVLQAQSSDPAYTSSNYNINFYNDGFQIVNADTGWNNLKETYIFMCFAA